MTSLEQVTEVVGGGGKASAMHFHLVLVWQKQKHRGKEGGWEEWAAVLEGGMLDAEERWTRWSLLLHHSVCMCVCVCVWEAFTVVMYMTASYHACG